MRWSFLILGVSLFTAYAIAFAGGSEPSQIERVVARWDFTSAEDALEWEAQHSVDPLELKDGALIVRAVDFDPYFASPFFELETTDFQYIRLKLRASRTGRSELFYAPAESQEEARFHGDWRMPFTISKAHEWDTVRVLPFWKPGHKVFRIRFDPPDGSAWEIAEIAIVERLVESLPVLPEYRFQTPADVAAWFPFQDISSMTLQDGSMVVRPDGNDPAIISSPCSFDASDRNILSLRARVSGADFAEFWYNPDPYGEFKAASRMSFSLIADGEFHSYNVPLSQARGYENEIGRIGLSLLDAEPNAELAVQFLSVGSSPSGPPSPDIESFSIGRTVSYPAEDSAITCVVSNNGGETARNVTLALALPQGATLTSASAHESLPSIEPMRTATVRWAARFPRSDSADPLTASVELTFNGREISAATAGTIVSRLVSPEEIRPDPGFQSTDGKDWVLQNGNLRLVFPRNAYGYGVIELWAGGPGKWKKMGVLPSLGTLTYLSSAGDEVSRSIYADESSLRSIISSEHGLGVSVGWTDADERQWQAQYSFSIEPGKQLAAARCDLSADRPTEIVAFTFPEYLGGDGSFGESRDMGFFPGLEYLLPGERSSGTDFCAAAVADRTAPHPYKITIPLMAVVRDGMATGILWDPLQKWDGEHAVPAAKFASPNFITPGANHLMGLFAPSLPDWFSGSERGSKGPYPLRPGNTLSLSASLFAIEAEDFAPIFHLWMRAAGKIPDVPPIPHECKCFKPFYAAVMKGYADVTWDEKARGWHRALADPWGPSYDSGTAMQMRWALENDVPMSDELRQKVADVLAAATEGREPASGAFAYYDGPLQERVQAWLTRGAPQADRVRADGTVPFEPDKEHSILGKRGDSSSGHTANTLQQVWNYARVSANPELIKVGLRGLAYLDTQIRPEGAQVWELQLHVPDVLASARIIPCYLAAYELLGDKHYLDEAVKWAYRGLPFIYFWEAPDRPIMPYGSIPVFGATWYTGGWFGRIVQWNGLEFADALVDLAEHDDSLDWRKIAEGITISAIQQTRPLDYDSYLLKDYIPDCGHIGMYPDAYSAVTGNDAYHWCLSGKRVLDLTLKLIGRDPGAKMTLVKAEGDTDGLPRASDLTAHIAHIGSVAYVKDAHYDSASLRFSTEILPKGATHRLYVHTIPEPASVMFDGEELRRLDDIEAAPVGYSWDAGILFLKLVQKLEKHEIEIVF